MFLPVVCISPTTPTTINLLGNILAMMLCQLVNEHITFFIAHINISLLHIYKAKCSPCPIGPAFIVNDHIPLTSKPIVNVLKLALDDRMQPGQSLSMHSLRRGGTYGPWNMEEPDGFEILPTKTCF